MYDVLKELSNNEIKIMITQKNCNDFVNCFTKHNKTPGYKDIIIYALYLIIQ